METVLELLKKELAKWEKEYLSGETFFSTEGLKKCQRHIQELKEAIKILSKNGNQDTNSR